MTLIRLFHTYEVHLVSDEVACVIRQASQQRMFKKKPLLDQTIFEMQQCKGNYTRRSYNEDKHII